ncbi:MAG TPA: FAD-binding oxidoreductase [Acidimicrobiales bacterium]|nr:FAD-binding oxidoreductase [Acidimicrobiales bacterium]
MNPGAPTPPIGWPTAELDEHFKNHKAPVPDDFVSRLSEVCGVGTGLGELAEAGRDWWPFAQRWALEGETVAFPAVVARPASVAEVQAVARLCNEAGVPLTAAGGRSGVCGSSVPVFGGVALDTCGLAGILEVDDESLLVDVAAGTFGPHLEAGLRSHHGLTIGHWPQSVDLATVGGWIACRGAGQYSTRYGKIEDIVAGLEVVLANGELVRTGAMAGAGPRSAMGPDLTQLFVGSEGVLGIVTAARLRAHPVAPAEKRAAFACPTFADGLHILRRLLRRGGTPAVVRLYDEKESKRNFDFDGNLLIVLDEGDATIIDAAMSLLAEEAERQGAGAADVALVERWLGHRNDVSALASVTRAGIVVDTIEISGPWAALPAIYDDAIAAVEAIDGSLVASAHESHAYLDGACIYFTFAGRDPAGGAGEADAGFAEAYYRAAWDAVLKATRSNGGSISHHHGIGLVRGPYLRDALGSGFAILEGLKHTLDPNGILNPGKLGLASRFGQAPW